MEVIVDFISHYGANIYIYREREREIVFAIKQHFYQVIKSCNENCWKSLPHKNYIAIECKWWKKNCGSIWNQ